MFKSGLILFFVLFAAAGAGAVPVTCAEELETGMDSFLVSSQLTFRLLGDFWGAEMRGRGVPFRAPKLNFYSDQTETACGPVVKKMGPVYCSASQTIYLEGSWFFEDSRHTGVPARFSVMFILAHEYAHHITQIIGLYRKMLDATLPKEDHALTSRMNELTMDGWAGIFFGHISNYKVIEERERDEIMKYIFACGDSEQGNCFHGTGIERLNWFRKGFRTRRLEEINAFTAPELFRVATDQTKAWITDVLFAR